jgi:ligand-binding sensor domain-containing protein
MGWRPILLATIALRCLIGEVLPIRPYTTADGLAADHVYNIVVDSHGFVWFCTPEGLSRFDGYRFVSFGVAEGLPSRSVQALLETRSGEYLVGTARGVCYFHAQRGGSVCTTYLPGDKPDQNYVTALFQDSGGRIWCGTYAGLFEALPGHKFRRQSLSAPAPGWNRVMVTDLRDDAGGRLWVASSYGIYVIGIDGRVEHITNKDGLPYDMVNALLRDRRGRVWAATSAGLALMRVAGQRGKYGVQEVYTDKGELHTNNVGSLAEAADGSIWMGTDNGIRRLLPDSRPLVTQSFTRAQGLIDRQIESLAAGEDGNLWVGTEGAGAMRIETAGFTTFREQDGLPSDRVWSVFADRSGTVMAVAALGTKRAWSVNIFDGARFHTVSPKVFSERPTW